MNTHEQLLIGACLHAPDMIRYASAQVTGADFADARLGGAFDALMRMRSYGQHVDPITVADATTQDGIRGVTFEGLLELMGHVSSGASVETYAGKVREASMRRQLAAVAHRITAEANNESVPVAQALAAAAEQLKAVMGAAASADDDPRLLRDLLAVDDSYEWAIPDMLERGDRMLVTGFEGGGKSTLLRQIVVLAAAGIHPLSFDPIRPVRCLVVDVENTERQWRRAVRSMAARAAHFGSADPRDSLRVRTDLALNITRDADLGRVHGWIDAYDPEVLMIGPLYKLVPGGIKGDEEASPVIAALDSIRARGVALVLEGHAAKATGTDGVRNLAPRGSAALMGWPEFGFGLHLDHDDPHKVNITRWRGDREHRNWPRELYRGGIFPWTADTVAPQRRNALYAGNAPADDYDQGRRRLPLEGDAA